MENKNYKVNIKDIYVGDLRDLGNNRDRILIKENGIYCYKWLDEEGKRYIIQNGQGFLLDRPKDQLEFSKGCGLFQSEETFLRTMLFTLDENNHANDLLYSSPHYPIFNISSNEDCLNASIGLTNNVFNLYNFLCFMKYTESVLGYDDILNIRKKYFNCDFIIDNCDLFGIEERDKYNQDETVTDSKGRLHLMEFTKVDWFSLERDLFRMILVSKDYFYHKESAKFVKGYQFEGELIDAFKPSEKEGPIKSLGSII